MWDWFDHVGWIVCRAGVSVAIVSSLGVLAMLGCRQPSRRIALARATLLGAILAIPLAGLAPLPRFEVFAALREVGILPHPLESLSFARAWPGLSTMGGPWLARGLLAIYLAMVTACLTILAVGCWGLVWLTRQST